MSDDAIQRRTWERHDRTLERYMRIMWVIAAEGRRGASPLSRLMIVVLLLPLMLIGRAAIQGLKRFTVGDSGFTRPGRS